MFKAGSAIGNRKTTAGVRWRAPACRPLSRTGVARGGRLRDSCVQAIAAAPLFGDCGAACGWRSWGVVMRCGDLERYLEAFLDGRLGRSRSSVLRRHRRALRLLPGAHRAATAIRARYPASISCPRAAGLGMGGAGARPGRQRRCGWWPAARVTAVARRRSGSWSPGGAAAAARLAPSPDRRPAVGPRWGIAAGRPGAGGDGPGCHLPARPGRS